MASPAHPPSVVCFGLFELDAATGELRKAGISLKIHPQPFQVLQLLARHPKQIVTRDEIRSALWGSNTFVDFERGINSCVNQIRVVLGDDPEKPRYIETLPRRGYRFIAPVRKGFGNEAAATHVSPTGMALPWPSSDKLGPNIPHSADLHVVARQADQARFSTWKRKPVFVIVCCFALFSAVGVAVWRAETLSSSPRGLPELKLTQLTADSSENAVTGGAISPDGKYLAYANVKGIHVKLIGTDQARDVPTPEELRAGQVTWTIPANWISGGTGFVANATPYGHRPSVWAVPTMSGPMRKIRDDALAFAVSRDGSWVAFGRNLNQFYYRELWLMKPDGGEARKLFDAEENSTFAGADWSPDGQRLAYVKWHQSADKGELSIESRGLKGDNPVRAISIPYDLADWSWSPDGRIITSFPDASDLRANTCNFWETRVNKRTGQPLGQPKRMTSWSGFCADEPSVSADGKRLTFRKTLVQSSVYVTNLQADGTLMTTPSRLTLNEGRNYPVAWTADSKAIVIMSDHNGKREALTHSLGKDAAETIAADLGNTVEPTQSGLVDLVLPRISPDGAWILYLVWSSDFASSAPTPLMRVPIGGGPAELVLTTTIGAVHSIRCARAPATTCLIAERNPDHTQLVFTAFDPLKGRGHEAVRFDTVPTPDAEYAWDFSPDGTRIAIVRRSDGSVQIVALSGHAPQKIVVKDWTSFQRVDWAADGRGLFVSVLTKEGSAISHLDLKGKTHLLREFEGMVQPGNSPFMGGSSAAWAVPSPDGRHLAICSWSISANMWMLENF
jgi:Tol biopolymer transport system component/DNA-binding winged helix-turn-helix (wHTH) protein